ncbi:hypothetical protein [Streptomyces sp. CC219B]|uniref:hypothetical protein n=1 Tax=Streptomyces sp. CC219B TaxID=3044574 RepID=UPI0024A8B4F5|nr:hypothetical protein [Streptomyces sp. CC219B]
MTNDAFSEAVRRRNQFDGVTFFQMAAESHRVGGQEYSRSTAWWNNMANYEMETPPAPKYVPGVASALDMSERRVNQLIAEQWYGVRPDDDVPSHLRSLVAELRGLTEEDVPVVEQLVKHLTDKNRTKFLLESELVRVQATREDEAEVEDSSAA